MAYIIGRANSEFAFDDLIERLREEYPETSTISDDYYAIRLAREKKIASELGMSDDSAPIRCTERVSSAHGIQRHISIPLSTETTVTARTDKLGILVVGKVTELPLVHSLIDILSKYPLDLEISWDDGVR